MLQLNVEATTLEPLFQTRSVFRSRNISKEPKTFTHVLRDSNLYLHAIGIGDEIRADGRRPLANQFPQEAAAIFHFRTARWRWRSNNSTGHSTDGLAFLALTQRSRCTVSLTLCKARLAIVAPARLLLRLAPGIQAG